MVLKILRRTENRKYPVSQELDDGAVILLYARHHRLEIPVQHLNELFCGQLGTQRGESSQVTHQYGDVLGLAAALLPFCRRKCIIGNVRRCIPDKCRIDFEQLGKIRDDYEIHDLIVVVAGHPYMKIADDAFVVHVIDDRLMRVDLVGDRIDEELDEVVVALDKGNGLPDLQAGIRGYLKKLLRRRVGIEYLTRRRDYAD